MILPWSSKVQSVMQAKRVCGRLPGAVPPRRTKA